MGYRVKPLGKAGASRDMLGSRLPAFGENREGQDKIGGAKAGGKPAGSAHSEQMNSEAAKGRSDDESQAEGHADETHLFRPLLGRSDVGDVGLGNGNVSAANTSE